MYYIC